MRKHHPENERTKRRYAEYLKDARQQAETSVDQALAAIDDFQAVTGHRDFHKFRIAWAQSYKRDLEERTHPKTGKPLAKATITARLMALRAFFQWLAGQPGFRSKITYSDTDYFRPSANDERIAKAAREKPFASIDDYLRVLRAMPAETAIEKRDRAVIAFAVLTGARDNAIASMSLKHVDLRRRSVFQDARDVRTKNRKTFTTDFFPVGEEIEAIVADWVGYLTTERGFEPGDPLFPATRTALGSNGAFAAMGFDRRHWRSAGPIRHIFAEAFTRAGVPCVNPHSVRHTLVAFGETLCRSPEDFKAWSQNLGHEKVLTTFSSYGIVSGSRQARVFESLRERAAAGAETGEKAIDPATLRQLRAFVDGLTPTAGRQVGTA